MKNYLPIIKFYLQTRRLLLKTILNFFPFEGIKIILNIDGEIWVYFMTKLNAHF